MSRYIEIDGCKNCPYSAGFYSDLVCEHKVFDEEPIFRKSPPTGIPDWCPLPTLKEEESDG